MNQLVIERTTSNHADFLELVKQLDAELAVRDGDDHAFYNQFNGVESLEHVVVLYDNGIPVGCGAFKQFEGRVMEIKRMYTVEDARGKGLASEVLAELELWAMELSYEKAILETGVKQPEAIALYKKNGYSSMRNYGPYEGVDTSYCFKKLLIGSFC